MKCKVGGIREEAGHLYRGMTSISMAIACLFFESKNAGTSVLTN